MRVIRILYEITSDYERGFDWQLRRLLELGCERLGLEIGILSRIEGTSYEVVKAMSPEGVDLNDGDTFELGNTYCAMTLEANGPVGFEHVGESEAASHPAYTSFGLESYIGTPVVVGGEVFGTLNFSSPRPRPRRFHEVDVDALKLMSVWLSSELHREQNERELRAASQRLELLTSLDPLTQLLNRRGLEEKLVRLARRLDHVNESVCALVIDVDDFKSVNDGYGHAGGDEVLKVTAETLGRAIRPTDVLGRVGGDEFVALLPQSTAEDAVLVGKRLCAAVEKQTISRLNGDPGPTVSVGVAPLDESVRTITALLERATTSLQQSKRGGKNRVGGGAADAASQS